MSTLTALLGIDASNNAGKAQAQSASQLNLSNQYLADAAQGYGNIQQFGQQQQNLYDNNFNTLQSLFANSAGINFQPQSGNPAPSIPQTQASSPTQLAGIAPAGLAANGGNPYAPGQLTQAQQIAQLQQANGLGTGNNRATPAQALNGTAQVQGNAAQQLNSQPQAVGGPNPYNLTQYQQQQINQQTTAIQQQGQQAASQFQSEMAASGITDPRALEAGQQLLQSHFSDLQSTTTANFMENARAQQEAAYQELLNLYTGIGQ
jgi:hypothetical protein